ncbi:mechanosensitive ion channel domain-containing protein [Algihabitans albus]|uniref:mechanosensitive ion channel domain-containing protein n=1 Tax=Algihabitans albus TaxID=2164067 RepID=UPI001ABCB694|nr:mechanosensitive ion channel domain-containing protein [Algihabitans albus]
MPGTQPPAGISLDDDDATDVAIERRIRTILGKIEDFSQVAVEVNAGVVTLTGRVLEAGDVEDLAALVARVQGMVTIENAVAETTDLSDRLNPAWERFLSRLDQVIAYLPLLLVAFAVFLVIAACGFILATSRQPFERLAPNRFIADIYRQIVRIAFILAGLVVALDILGAVALIGTLLGAAGLVGLAIGFAVRDTVENFMASIILSVRQPFRPNDFVEIDGEQGNVIRLTSRATILLSSDGNHIRIPNATVFKSRILNFSPNPERRFEFDLGVDADADLATAQAVGDSNVVVRLIGWIDQRKTDFLVARGEAIRVTKEALESEGFGLPEPI